MQNSVTIHQVSSHRTILELSTMKAFIVILAIAAASAFPDQYINYEQQQQQDIMAYQWPQHQPQQQQQNQMNPDGYKIVPGVVDSRCPRSDDPHNPVHLPIRGDCTKFMKCYGGRAYVQLCPTGLEFGVAVNRCDYPEEAKCSNFGGW